MGIFDTLGGGYGGYGGGYGATLIGMALSIILALAGGIILHFTFLSPKNEGKYTGFVGWLYDFLNFKKLMLESLLRILYLIVTVYFICAGFSLLFSSFLGGITFMVVGLVLTRIGYEFILLTILLYRNTADINKKLGNVNNPSPISPTQAHQYTEASPSPAPVGFNQVQTPVDVAPIQTPVDVAPIQAPVDVAPVPTPVEIDPIPTPTEVTPIPAPVEIDPIPTPVEVAPTPVPEIVTPISNTCPTCHKEVAPNAKFCGTCGTKQG